MTILNSVCTNRTIYSNDGTQYELLYQKHKCKYHKHPIKWSQCNAMHDNNIWCCQSCNCSPNPFGDKANFQRLKPMFFSRLTFKTNQCVQCSYVFSSSTVSYFCNHTHHITHPFWREKNIQVMNEGV